MSSKEIETQLERQETWEDNLWEMLTLNSPMDTNIALEIRVRRRIK